ncbi:MAG: alpha-amylase family glycosyl hydrolase, partial [Aggregatilineales bacterium]
NTPVRLWLGGDDVNRDYRDPTLLPTEALAEQMQAYLAAVPYPIALQQFNQLDSHDVSRILRVVDGNTNLVKLAIALLMAFPGVPCLYYGTEIGLDGGHDPDNRRTMLWDEADWNMSLLEHTKAWIQARQASSALKHGGIEFLYAVDDVLAFARHSEDETLIFVGYRGKQVSGDIAISVKNAGIVDGVLQDRISDDRYVVQNGMLKLSGMQPGAAFLLELNH